VRYELPGLLDRGVLEGLCSSVTNSPEARPQVVGEL
jgi:hypothetical protein